MIESPHVAVGAAIATKIPNPLIGLPLALASHFLLDRVPHWNPHSYTEIQKHGKISNFTKIFSSADVVVALGIGFFTASQKMPNLGQMLYVLIASFLAVLPDLAKSPYFLMGARKGMIKKYVDFERSIQVDIKSPIVGLTIQALVIVVAMLWAN